MNLKKILAVLGVFCALVACFAFSTSASLIVYPDSTLSAVPYEVTSVVPDSTSINYFVFPYSAGSSTTFTSPPFVFGYNTGEGYRSVDISLPTTAITRYMHVRLASPVAFPMNDGSLSVNGDKFTYDVEHWEATADYVVTFPDGSYTSGTYDFRDGATLPDGSHPVLSFLAHVRDYLQYTYPTASKGFVTSLEVEGLTPFTNQDVGFLYEANCIYSPITTDDIRSTVFDGNVGAADLLLGPLDAFFNFEIFPNFTLGGVFGVIISILLFVVILKLFAGG